MIANLEKIIKEFYVYWVVERIDSVGELWKVINRVRKIGWKEGFPGEDRQELGELSDLVSYEGISHDWTKAHFRMRYQDRDICVGVPKWKGRLGISLARPLGDVFFNDGFVSYQTKSNAVISEMTCYIALNAISFPTLKAESDLWIWGMQERFGYNKRNSEVTITKWEEGESAANLMGPEETGVVYASKIAEILRKLHDCNTIWGDANPINAISTNDGVKIFNFYMALNQWKSSEFLMAKDLTNLALTSRYESGDSSGEVEKSIVEAYSPGPGVREELERQLERDLERWPGPLPGIRERYFDKLVYGLDSEGVRGVKEALLNVVA